MQRDGRGCFGGHGRHRARQIQQAPVLDIRRTEEIHRATALPLVLHGGSGVPDDQVKMAIQAGVRKMNFATDLVCTFFDSVYAKKGEVKAMDVFMKEPVEASSNMPLARSSCWGQKR